MVICLQMKNVLEMLGYFPTELRLPVEYEKKLKFLKKIPIQFMKNCVVFTAHILYCMQPIAFLFIKADHPSDYQESLFFTNHSLICLISYTIFVMQKAEILLRITDFKTLIDQSELIVHWICYLNVFTRLFLTFRMQKPTEEGNLWRGPQKCW